MCCFARTTRYLAPRFGDFWSLVLLYFELGALVSFIFSNWKPRDGRTQSRDAPIHYHMTGCILFSFALSKSHYLDQRAFPVRTTASFFQPSYSELHIDNVSCRFSLSPHSLLQLQDAMSCPFSASYSLLHGSASATFPKPISHIFSHVLLPSQYKALGSGLDVLITLLRLIPRRFTVSWRTVPAIWQNGQVSIKLYVWYLGWGEEVEAHRAALAKLGKVVRIPGRYCAISICSACVYPICAACIPTHTHTHTQSLHIPYSTRLLRTSQGYISSEPESELGALYEGWGACTQSQAIISSSFSPCTFSICSGPHQDYFSVHLPRDISHLSVMLMTIS